MQSLLLELQVGFLDVAQGIEHVVLADVESDPLVEVVTAVLQQEDTEAAKPAAQCSYLRGRGRLDACEKAVVVQ